MRRCVLWGRARVRRERRDRRGAAAVEFALVLPILLVLVFGIINYGDMLSVRQSVSQAASEGARAAAVNPGDDTAKKEAALDAVRAALDAQNQSCADDGCTVTFETCEDARCARVKVLIDYDTLIPGFGLVLPKTLTYTAVARVS